MADSQKKLAAEVLAALLKLQDEAGVTAAIDSKVITEKILIRDSHALVGTEINNARADAWFAVVRLAGALNYNPATPDRERLQSAAINAAERWRFVA